MTDPNLALLETAVTLLAPVLNDLVFTGGCTTALFITDTGFEGIRPTDDVDAIVEVASYAEYATLSDRLHALGLREDDREGAPLCRWVHKELVVDIMPTDERVLGFSSRWFRAAALASESWTLAGHRVRVVAPVYFLATKIEAFRRRGHDDYPASHDLEDVIAVVDGRATIADEVMAAPSDVRGYVTAELGQMLRTRAFIDALPGFLLPDAANQARLPRLLGRLRAMAGAG